jgi:hypothetical protein
MDAVFGMWDGAMGREQGGGVSLSIWCFFTIGMLC